MKQVVVIGGSGFVGTAIVKEALSRGYTVKTIVRHPEKMSLSDPHLEVIGADIMNTEELTGILKGQLQVISAYNPGWKNPDIYEDTLKGYTSILEAVRRAGVRRLLVVGGAGSLLVAPTTRLMDTGTIPEEILPGVKSLAKVYMDYLRPEREFDWVFFSPAGSFTQGTRTGHYRLGDDYLIRDQKGESHISVEDYAMAMIDELEKPQHHYRRFTIGY